MKSKHNPRTDSFVSSKFHIFIEHHREMLNSVSGVLAIWILDHHFHKFLVDVDNGRDEFLEERVEQVCLLLILG